MKSPDEKVDMEAMNAAIDKFLAYDPSPKADQDKKRSQRRGRPTSSVRETKGSYKTAKP